LFKVVSTQNNLWKIRPKIKDRKTPPILLVLNNLDKISPTYNINDTQIKVLSNTFAGFSRKKSFIISRNLIERLKIIL